ncbi:hypothetical protein DPMN_037586 [Dreissena polymorpha]|uniref:G-protein coupled receptors family 1 profile domain-containing protein n=2 Tax=Dreissena polymorpha TaxID=45954 RepID=A0A9D4MET5_DREPO|nr:hypothetical protein DPMN_037586 [Dreissena polymorpha]
MRLKVVAYEEGGKQNVASIATSPLTPVRQDSQELTSQSEFSGLIKRSAMDQEMSSASIVGDAYFKSATFSDRSHQTTFGDDVPSSTKNNMCKQTSPVHISLVPSSTELSSGPSDIESALSVTTVAFSETSETFTETYETTSFAWNTMITQDTSRTPSISEKSTTSSLTSAMTQPVTNVTERYPTSHITVSTSNFPRLRTEDAESVEDRLLCFALSDVGYSDFFNFVYPWMDLLLYFLVPAVILCIGEIIIVRKLIASNRLRRRMFVTDGAMTPQRIPNRRASVTIMLMTVNAVFILCTTPISVFLIGMPYWVDPELGFSKTQEILWAVVNLLMYLNHSINFVLYFLSGSRFRSHVYQLFRRNAVHSVHIDRLSFSQKDTASEEASIQRQLTLRSMVAAADKARKISDRSVRGSYTRRHTSEGRDTIPFPGKAAKLMHTDHVPKELTGNDINNKKECLHQVRVSNESVVVGKHTSVTLNDEVLHDTIYTETPFSFIKETNSRFGGHLVEGFGGIDINDIDIFTHI